jgi:hypothetical protein
VVPQLVRTDVFDDWLRGLRVSTCASNALLAAILAMSARLEKA